MKQKPITLRQFVETFPLQSFVKIEENIPFNFNELNWVEKYAIVEQNLSNIKRILKVTKESISYSEYHIRAHRVGNKFFLKSSSTAVNYICISPTKVNVKILNYIFVLGFLKLLDKNFSDYSFRIVSVYFTKPAILRAILTKRIYSQETLYKFIGKRCYGLSDFNWRLLKDYLEQCNYRFSIQDVAAFTKNLNDSLTVLTDKSKHFYEYQLYDLISSAVKLNQVVDLTWSPKRIHKEHQKQIELLNVTEIEAKDKTPVYDTNINGENIQMLNTELDVFKEGSTMHHCLYTCYWRSIRNHSYMAWHMTYPEDCTFSVKKDGDKIVFDQIHMAYNFIPQDTTILTAEEFIDNNKERILKCFKDASDDENETFELAF